MKKKKNNKRFNPNLVVELSDTSTKRKKRLQERIKFKVNEKVDNFKPLQKVIKQNESHINEWADEISDMKADEVDQRLIDEAIETLKKVTPQRQLTTILEELETIHKNY